MADLPKVSRSDLVEMKIPIGPRNKILSAIENLGKQENPKWELVFKRLEDLEKTQLSILQRIEETQKQVKTVVSVKNVKIPKNHLHRRTNSLRGTHFKV